MSETKTLLLEIYDICTAFESLLQEQNKAVVEQMQQICETARIEITEKDKRIDELKAESRLYKEAIRGYIATTDMIPSDSAINSFLNGYAPQSLLKK